MKLYTVLLFTLFAFLLLVPAVAADFAVKTRQNVVLFGDSITAMGDYGQLMQDMIDEKYPERRIRVLSHGSHGDTVHGSLKRVETDVIRWRPSWVLINFGINDCGRYTTEEFITHYENLINRVYRDTDAQVGVVSPVYQDHDTANPRLEEYVVALRALAKKYDARYIPVYEETKRLRPTLPKGVMYAADGTHPNRIGYWIFAETILKALNYPLPRTLRTVDVPARRTNRAQSDELAGTTFRLDLPMPLQIRLTNPPLQAGTAVRAPKPIVLDGKLNEWNLGKPMLLTGHEQLSWGVMSWARDHFQANGYACYTDEALYFAIDVDDSVVRNTARPEMTLVERDFVELCLDGRPAIERAKAPWVGFINGKNICQYVLTPASPEIPQGQVLMGNGDKGMLDGITVASAPTNRGYVIECRLPAKYVPDGLKPGTAVGFDFTVTNEDRYDRYLSAIALRWSGSTWSAFHTREFGTLTLAE